MKIPVETPAGVVYIDVPDTDPTGVLNPDAGEPGVTNPYLTPPPGQAWGGAGWVDRPPTYDPSPPAPSGPATAAVPPSQRTEDPPTTTTTTTGDGGGAPTNTGFIWPQLSLPAVPSIAPFVPNSPYTPEVYQAPTPYTPTHFSYADFVAPTIDEARNEPGYAFAAQEGRKAVENSAAARGVLRTGATLKDILAWGDRFGEQNYNNVYGRKANTYTLNRNNAFQNWGANEANDFGAWTANEGARFSTFAANEANKFKAWQSDETAKENAYSMNTGTTLGLYDRSVSNAKDIFAPVQQDAMATFDDNYRRWLAQLQATTQIALGPGAA